MLSDWHCGLFSEVFIDVVESPFVEVIGDGVEFVVDELYCVHDVDWVAVDSTQ